MAEANLETALICLENTLEEIKSLLAWEQLKWEEARPGGPPGFALHENIDGDLRNLYSIFLTTSLDIRSRLNDVGVRNLSQTQQHRYKRQLLQIERQMRSLNLPERFINP